MLHKCLRNIWTVPKRSLAGIMAKVCWRLSGVVNTFNWPILSSSLDDSTDAASMNLGCFKLIEDQGNLLKGIETTKLLEVRD